MNFPNGGVKNKEVVKMHRCSKKTTFLIILLLFQKKM